MLSRYINEAIARASYKLLEDETCFGEIPGIAGVWANERSLDKCRETLAGSSGRVADSEAAGPRPDSTNRPGYFADEGRLSFGARFAP